MNAVLHEQSRHAVSEFSITEVFSEGLIPRVQHRTQVTYIRIQILESYRDTVNRAHVNFL